MTKQQMLDAIENMKQMHNAQMQKIENVIEGKEIDEPTPLSKKECSCGEWFYSNEKELKDIFGAQLLEKFDLCHEKWHQDYLKIYEIYFKDQKKGFFSKLLGSSKIDAMQTDKARVYFTELQSDTEVFFQTVNVASRRVHALSDAKFH